jgi:hypothetical protein
VLEVVYASLLVGMFLLVSGLGVLTVYRLFKGQD